MLHLYVMMEVISSTQKFFSTRISYNVITTIEDTVVLDKSVDTSILKKFVVNPFAEKDCAVKDIQLFASIETNGSFSKEILVHSNMLLP